MNAAIVFIIIGVFVISAVLTAVMRRLALRHGVLDVPNERSSHRIPTPRGGGVSIALASMLAVVSLTALRVMPLNVSIALGGGLAVALIGFLDDRNKVSAGMRLFVHGIAALWALAWLGGLPALRVGEHVISFSWGGYILGALGIVWTLNLFNFMDGIDGIAASEATFVACAAGALIGVSAAPSPLLGICLAFGAACLGFLLWNWPPAKIFMGDVGSGYLGFFIAVLAIAAARDNGVALLVWLILGGVFFTDATVTFLRRLARGEPVQQAHRSHAYQWLARRGRSHARVTSLVMLVNVLWLLPWAWAATLHPERAAWIAALALAPLALLALLAGAGRSENSSDR